MCLGTKVNCMCVCVFLCGVFASPGMVLSVLVVLLLTVFYELLKVWRVWLGSHSKLAQPQSRYATQTSYNSDRTSVLEGGPSESSLFPIEPQPPAVSTRKRSGNTTVALQTVNYNINSQIDVMADLFFFLELVLMDIENQQANDICIFVASSS